MIGAIDKTVDHDHIPSAWSRTQETSRLSQAHHSFVTAHRPANSVNSNNSNTAWPVDEKRDVYQYEQRLLEPEVLRIQSLRESQSDGPPPSNHPPRFLPRPDSSGESFKPALPRQSSVPHGIAEVPH